MKRPMLGRIWELAVASAIYSEGMSPYPESRLHLGQKVGGKSLQLTDTLTRLSRTSCAPGLAGEDTWSTDNQLSVKSATKPYKYQKYQPIAAAAKTIWLGCLKQY